MLRSGCDKTTTVSVTPVLVGENEGALEGAGEGFSEGRLVLGRGEGGPLGREVPLAEGARVGIDVPIGEGTAEGRGEGNADGARTDGAGVGGKEGCIVGTAEVGRGEGVGKWEMVTEVEGFGDVVGKCVIDGLDVIGNVGDAVDGFPVRVG